MRAHLQLGCHLVPHRQCQAGDGDRRVGLGRHSGGGSVGIAGGALRGCHRRRLWPERTLERVIGGSIRVCHVGEKNGHRFVRHGAMPLARFLHHGMARSGHLLKAGGDARCHEPPDVCRGPGRIGDAIAVAVQDGDPRTAQVLDRFAARQPRGKRDDAAAVSPGCQGHVPPPTSARQGRSARVGHRGRSRSRPGLLGPGHGASHQPGCGSGRP